MDIEHARFNMIEQQIRTWEVLDSWVLSTLQDFHREDFVPAGYTDLAFADIQIPIGHGQTMMEPRLEARLLQTLALTGGESVLEIGTGTGYMTALLARCAKTVTSVDIHGDFLKGAAQRLRETGINTVTLEEGDAADGWKPGSTWDAILLTGSVSEIPPAFEEITGKPEQSDSEMTQGAFSEEDAMTRQWLFSKSSLISEGCFFPKISQWRSDILTALLEYELIIL